MFPGHSTIKFYHKNTLAVVFICMIAPFASIGSTKQSNGYKFSNTHKIEGAVFLQQFLLFSKNFFNKIGGFAWFGTILWISIYKVKQDIYICCV